MAQISLFCVCHTGFSNINGESYGNGARCVEQGDQPWTASAGLSASTAGSSGAGCYQVMSSSVTIASSVSNTQVHVAPYIDHI